MRNSTDALMVYVTVPDAAVADAITKQVLQNHQAACCQTIGPINSQYRWKGNIESASEYLLLLKTRQEQLAALESSIAAMHPYDVPEIVVVTIVAGHAPYLDWLQQETSGNSQ